jgi:glucose-6-phosphate isomerase
MKSNNDSKFSYEYSGLDQKETHEQFNRLGEEHERICSAWNTGYDSVYASINLSNDRQLAQNVKNLAAQKLSYNPEMVIVIGIGGSSLGTRAVHEAINGTLYNEISKRPRLYFVESIDSDYTTIVLKLAEQVLHAGKTIIVTIVTKSGTTTETIVNGALFVDLLQKFYGDSHTKYVVAITDLNSKLYHAARKAGYDVLEIPENVGGRFSVLSAVGLFPLALVGIDIDKLIDGARSVGELVCSQPIEHNDSARNAVIKYVHYVRDRININDMFIFSLNWAALGHWYRQLMGESIGKMHDRTGKVVERGITPTVSIGTIDLHSVGQLYLGGPRDKFITFVYAQERTSLVEPQLELFSSLVPHVAGKTLSHIKRAIFDGVIKAYSDQQRPFVVCEIAQSDEYEIGKFLQMYMFEMIYLGYLLQVNPFDQPQVELYKTETRKILAT